MILGFTSTRSGMSAEQKRALIDRLVDGEVDRFIHGGCVGGDEESHWLIREFSPNTHIVVYAVTKKGLDLVAVDTLKDADTTVHFDGGHFARNRKVIEVSDEIYGAPYLDVAPEENAGGTWYTINRAIKSGKPVTLLRRDGSFVLWNHEEVDE